MKTSKVHMFDKIKLGIKKFFTKHKPVSKNDWIRLIVLAIAIPIFVYSSSLLVYRLYKYVYEDKKNNEIIELKPSIEDPFESFEESAVIEDPIVNDFAYQIILGDSNLLNENGILHEYQNLVDRNSDMVGWINFPNLPGKDINYPILQADDNIYYLNYDFDKNRSYSGSIYTDYRNNPYSENPLNIDKNYIVTGHAMKNGSMFGTISHYWSDEKAWEDAKYIYIDLLNTKLQYEVISSFVTNVNFDYKRINFETDEEYVDYLNTLVSKSSNNFNAPELTADDKIVTLETCFGTGRRTITVGRLIRQIIYEMPEIEDETIVEHISKDETPSGSDITPSVTPVVLPSDIPSNVPFPTEARAVMALIDEIPNTIALNDVLYVYEVYEEFEELDNYQTGAVSVAHKDKLNDAKEEADKIYNLANEKALQVVNLINKLPDIELITLENKDKVILAKEAFNKLNDFEKDLVTNIIQLSKIEVKIAALTNANVIIELIEGLPDVEDLTLADEDRVNNARAKFDELTPPVSQYVTNFKVLEAAETKINKLKESESSSQEESNDISEDIPSSSESEVSAEPTVSQEP